MNPFSLLTLLREQQAARFAETIGRSAARLSMTYIDRGPPVRMMLAGLARSPA